MTVIWGDEWRKKAITELIHYEKTVTELERRSERVCAHEGNQAKRRETYSYILNLHNNGNGRLSSAFPYQAQKKILSAVNQTLKQRRGNEKKKEEENGNNSNGKKRR